jgi:pimeloyl-ACP methyl ester carboxylesterase
VDKNLVFQSAQIFYRVSGTGRPLLLVHGFAEDGSIWDEQVRYLKQRYMVIVPDLPGSGRSPFNTQLSTIDDYASCLKALAEKEKLGSCIMIGHSMGGYISLACAEKFPGLLHGFGLFHSTAYADSEEKKNARRKSIEFIRQYGSAAFIHQSVPNLYAEHFKNQAPQTVSALVEKYAGFDPLSLIQYYEAMIKRPDRTAVLKKFPGPVLFVIGEQDKAVPMEDCLQQCHMPGWSQIDILENVGHMGMIEHAAGSGRIIEQFAGLVP